MWIWLVLWFVGLVGLGIWFVRRLQGPDLSRFDRPASSPVVAREEPSAQHSDVVAQVEAMTATLDALPRKERLAAMRRILDEGFGAPPDPSVSFHAVDAGGVAAEWVQASSAKPERRLLYIHGGAFVAGSTKSHRGITAKISELAEAAVLSIDYRLMPEHKRQDGIDDCRAAYRWILENGPEGPGAPEILFMSGDSAGGNLALMLLAWARDTGLRAVDGAVVLSPGTDVTMSAPSIVENLPTDPMLAPMLRDFLRMPRPVRLFITWATTKIKPSDPRVSPVFGGLSGLPPVLVHASEAEVLRDDAKRWVNKAREAGSPASLETWPHVVHVWHAFAPDLPESVEAWEHIRQFFEHCALREVATAS